jgi:osmoprotectant transport system permease protein
MTEIWAGILWLLNPENYVGRYGVPTLLGEHLWLSAAAIVPAGLLAIAIGLAIGHTGRGVALVVGLSSAARAIPTLGLLLALVLAFGVTQRELAVILALAAIAFPPLLAAAYSGVQLITGGVVDAARAQGLSEWQLVLRVELPLAAPQLIGGLRSASLQVISTAVLAPLVGMGGLGFGIVQGLSLRQFDQVIASGIMIVLLALTIDMGLAALQRLLSRRLGGARLAHKRGAEK